MGFRVSASQAVVVLVEVHHLETLELFGDFIDLLLLAGLLNFDTGGVPAFEMSHKYPGLTVGGADTYHRMYSGMVVDSTAISYFGRAYKFLGDDALTSRDRLFWLLY